MRKLFKLDIKIIFLLKKIINSPNVKFFANSGKSLSAYFQFAQIDLARDYWKQQNEQKHPLKYFERIETGELFVCKDRKIIPYIESEKQRKA